MSTTISATIDGGIRVVREWQRGSTAELDRWGKRHLTRRGHAVLADLTRTMDTAAIRDLVTRALNAGY